MGIHTLVIKTLGLLLGALLMLAPVTSFAEGITYLEKGDKAPYPGYLLSDDIYDKALEKSSEAQIYEAQLMACQDALNQSYKRPFWESRGFGFFAGVVLTIGIGFAVAELVD